MPEQALAIRHELSAQRMSHPPNPAFGGKERFRRLADLGCGKLRHFQILCKQANSLFLVDTEKQLSATHMDRGQAYNIREFVENASNLDCSATVLNCSQFSVSHLGLDVVVCVAVFDVVLPSARVELARSAFQNLSPGGHFVVIAPRNDSTILSRFTDDNRLEDGYSFRHHGAATFFANFRDPGSVVGVCQGAGFRLLRDLSKYRQLSLVFTKEG